jgi:hypothetical protein
LLGLDFDIKKWQQSKLLVSQEIGFLPKSPCFFLATFEERFLFFHSNGRFLSGFLKFMSNWLFFSFSYVSFQFLFLANLIKGLEIQNHCISIKHVNLLKTPSTSPFERSCQKRIANPLNVKQNLHFFSHMFEYEYRKHGKDATPIEVECDEAKAKIELKKICRKKKIILDILPSKAYQKRFFESIKKNFIQCRGKSSKFLIASLISIFSSWQDGIFYNGRTISLKKIFRKIDSFLHFKLFRWAKRNHPTWGRQKIVERYFPQGKIWSYGMKKRVENWVFCDTLSFITPLFLRKLSWFDRKNFQKIIFLEFIFSGVF